VGGTQRELFGALVVLEDRAAVGAGELAGAGDDGVEHRLDIEGGGDGSADLAEGRQLLDGLGQLARARLELLEKSDVLDGDDCLVAEGLQELDLAVGERPGLGTHHRDDADGSAFPQHRDPETAAKASVRATA